MSLYALSIRQPWAHLILHHGKDIENRTWRPSPQHIGKRFMVHASQYKASAAEHDEIAAYFPDLPWSQVLENQRFGVVLGAVTLAAVVTESESRWFTGPFGLVLRDPVPYDSPFLCRGRLGFFRPVDNVREEIQGVLL